MGAGFEREARGRECATAGLESRACTPEPSFFADNTGGIEQAKPAPLVPEIKAKGQAGVASGGGDRLWLLRSFRPHRIGNLLHNWSPWHRTECVSFAA